MVYLGEQTQMSMEVSGINVSQGVYQCGRDSHSRGRLLGIQL